MMLNNITNHFILNPQYNAASKDIKGSLDKRGSGLCPSSGNRAALPCAWQATLAKMQPLVLTSLLAGIIVALGYVLFLDHHL
jgi:hypothetical protein